MKIDNKRNIYRIWLRKMIITIIFTIGIVSMMFINEYKLFWGVFTKYHIMIAIAAVFIIISTIGVIRSPYYFYFDDINDVLVFKYYPVGFFNSKKHSVQIPKQQFLKYETSKYLLGTQERLVLYQLYRSKEAKYPPINLSALNKEEQKKLKLTLEKYCQK